MTRRTIRFWIGFAAVLVAGVRCTGPGPLSGGTTETGNAKAVVVTGSVVDSLGKPVPSARIQLLPASFNPLSDTFPVDTLRGTTSLQGAFELHHIEPGTYTLFCIDSSSGRGFQVFDLFISRVYREDTMTLQPLFVRKPCSLVIVVDSYLYQENGKLYIPGTRLTGLVDTNQTAVIHSIFTDTIPRLVYYNTRVNRSIRIYSNIPSGDTCLVAASCSVCGQERYID